ncbi:MAG: GNAT family N-acetyltransferase [Paenisporosarcina sp.]
MWKINTFNELTVQQLYTYLQLRVNVFIVEQKCPYPELDGYDINAFHLAYFENEKLLAYARILPQGVKYNRISIGRVIVDEEVRGKGLAKEVMKESLSFIQKKWPLQEVQLQAQSHLQSFYGSFGFESISEEYDEDGIPHVDMVKKYYL